MRQLAIPLAAVLLTGSVPAQAVGGPAQPVTSTDDGSDIAVHTLAVPAAGSRQEHGSAAAAPGDAAPAARLPARDTDGFDLVALTWKRGSTPRDVRAEVRTRDGNGWSPWIELAWEPDEGPAPGEADGKVRDGTEPVWVGDADGVAARVFSATGEPPRDLRVDMIDPGETADDSETAESSAAAESSEAAEGSEATGESADVGSEMTAAGFSARPPIVSRRGWGADPSLTSRCSRPVNGQTVRMVFVHHTVNTNNYTRREARALIRSIYAYHTQSRGWCDIGYNFLVDRFGTKYEGRRGGYNTPRRGAHVAHYNTDTAGIAALGNFERAKPTRKMRNGLRRLIAWKLSSYYRNPTGRLTLNGTRLGVISGHRAAGATACPGRHLYQWLPTLRQRVKNTMASTDTPIYRKWQRLGRRTLGPPFRGEADVTGGGRRTTFDKGRIFWKQDAGAHKLRDRIDNRYKKTGGPGGWLGYPVNDAHDIAVPRARLQRFEGGRIWFHPDIGPRALPFGAISQRYLREGGATGRLGMPVRQIYPVRGGTEAEFQNGWVRWHRSSRSTSVRYR